MKSPVDRENTSAQVKYLERLNALNSAQLAEDLFKCSGSAVWAEQMAKVHPFASVEELKSKSETAWKRLTRADWLAAFAHHPKIGDVESLRKKFATTASWAANEQSGVGSASADTINRLARGNQAYEARFGYIFIVCATGKMANEMLALLETRLEHEPDTEFDIACREQKQITQLRLERLES